MDFFPEKKTETSKTSSELLKEKLSKLGLSTDLKSPETLQEITNFIENLKNVREEVYDFQHPNTKEGKPHNAWYR
ncbi:MAG: hypothetical protein QM752_03795 [Gammaproteobacteria bacterium]